MLLKKRVNSYTDTAGISYNLLHTELAVRQCNNKKGYIELKSFRDYDVHKVLIRSNIKRVNLKNSKGKEWFRVDLDTAKRAIQAVKENHYNLQGSVPSEDFIPIVLRPEQEEAISKTQKHFKKANSMLWNAKMRFGKTITALELIKRSGFQKCIIVTHRPVVDEGWRDDFNKVFNDADGYKYCSKKDIENDRNLYTLGNKFIYFASIQDLRGSSFVDGKYDKNKTIFDMQWDLVIVDEAHEGTTTALGDEVIRALVKEETSPNTKFLALSGTPFNIVSKYDEESIYTWDYTMEQKAKNEWEILNFGDSNPYSDLPRLNIYTYDLGKLLKSASYVELVDKAFNFTEFFKVRKKETLNDSSNILSGDEFEFVHKEDVRSFLNLISEPNQDSHYPYSTEEYRNLFKHTLWTVPGVKEAKALKELMLNHSVFGRGQFEIVNVAGNEENDDALSAVKNAIEAAGDEGYTITLSCGKLTTGVTVPEWTAVFMLSGSYATSASSYLQTIFRVQSPCNKNGKVKVNSYVFDFAPDRTLKMIADAVSISKRAGKTQQSDRDKLEEFLNFCPVISLEGTQMKKYSTDKLLQQLKRAYADRALRTGFDDTSIYNDELFKLDNDNLKVFNKLQEIIGKTSANHSVKNIDLNNQGFTDEQYEKFADINKKKKEELTEEEKKLLEKFKKIKKNRNTAISILRGISVRMPLLIYGADIKFEDEFKIEDFLDNKIVDENSWKEFMPNGVTKKLFKEFIKYYDKDVFIAAGRKIRNITKLADSLAPKERIKKIAELFSYFRNPDKETVLTPWRVVNLHLGKTLGGYCFYDENFDKLIEEPRFIDNLDITSSTLRLSYANILEINSKTGLYPLYVAYSIFRAKLQKFNGLDLDEKQIEELWNSTITENIYVICKTEMAKQITKRTLVGFKNVNINAHYFENLINTLKSGKEKKFINKVLSKSFWGKDNKDDMKFNAVIGNPPYQETSKDTSDLPVYNLFMDSAFKLAPIVSFITPARFLFNAGKTPKEWNKKILNDEHFKVIDYYPKSTDIFPNVDIKGGIAISLHNDNETYKKIGIFSYFPELISILRKVNCTSEFSLASIVNQCTKFNLKALYDKYPKYIELIGSNGREKRLTTKIFEQLDCFVENKDEYNTIEIKGLIKNNRISKYINISLIEQSKILCKYKVIVPKSNGSGALGEVLSTPMIGQPMIGHTQSFINFGPFDIENEAIACLKYIKTKFARCLLGSLKVTQHNPKSTWENVPIQNFSNNYDIDWTKSVHEIDLQLYKKYCLSEKEIAFIEEKIQEME